MAATGTPARLGILTLVTGLLWFGQSLPAQAAALSVTMTAQDLVPGLPSVVSVDATPTTGETITGITWDPVPGCLLDVDDEVSPDAVVTCLATRTAAVTVTVHVTDSSGATADASVSPVLVTAARTATASLLLDGDDPGSRTYCPTAGRLAVQIVDPLTGEGVRGIAVSFRQSRTSGSPTVIASGVTDRDGFYRAQVALRASTYYAVTTSSGPWTVAAVSSAVSYASCQGAVFGQLSQTSGLQGTRITASGKAYAVGPPTPAPAAGQAVELALHRTDRRIVVLGRTTTGWDGSWTADVPLAASGYITARLAGVSGVTGASQGIGSVQVTARALRGQASVRAFTLGTTRVYRVSGMLGAVIAPTVDTRGQLVQIWYAPTADSPRRLLRVVPTGAYGAFTQIVGGRPGAVVVVKAPTRTDGLVYSAVATFTLN